MTWVKSREDRERDARTYGDPTYRRNRAAVRRRSGGRCEIVENGRQCGSRDHVQCDHIIPVTQGGTHAMENLRDTCGPHHRAKTAQEGGGYRRKGPRPPETDPAPQPRTRW